jgi:hypothetical protein
MLIFICFIVIGELGMHGIEPVGDGVENALTIRLAQQNVCESFLEYQNSTNCKFARTAPYAVLNGTKYDALKHYYGRADTVYHVGQSMGNAMIEMGIGQEKNMMY